MIHQTVMDGYLELIRAHGGEAAPLEACGVIVTHGSGPSRQSTSSLLPARNIHAVPESGFMVDFETMRNAYHLGTVAYIYHTHPETHAQPSEVDQEACDRMDVPFLIYSLPDNNFHTCHPRPLWLPLMRAHWVWGEDDCLSLISKYFKLAHYLDVPIGPWRPGDSKSVGDAKDLFDESARRVGFEIVEGPPKISDVYSFRMGTRFANHVAIYIGDHRILHHMRDELVCVDELRDSWMRRVCHHYRWAEFR